MIEPFELVQCVQFRDQLPGGITAPLLVQVRAQGTPPCQAVLKLANPGTPIGPGGHFGPTSLACELICAMLARLLGLPVPDYFVARIEMATARSAPERFRPRLQLNVGSNFATRYRVGAGSWLCNPDERRDWVVRLLEDVLAFDAVLLNGDRSARKTNLLYDGTEMWLIDHSLALPVQDGRRLLVDSEMFPRPNILAHCAYPIVQGQRRSFDSFFTRWRSRVDTPTLNAIRQLIPPPWETTPGDLDAIFGFLERRYERFDDIQQALTEVVR